MCLGLWRTAYLREREWATAFLPGTLATLARTIRYNRNPLDIGTAAGLVGYYYLLVVSVTGLIAFPKSPATTVVRRNKNESNLSPHAHHHPNNAVARRFRSIFVVNGHGLPRLITDLITVSGPTCPARPPRSKPEVIRSRRKRTEIVLSGRRKNARW